MHAITNWYSLDIIFSLFKQVGNPTPASTALLKQLQKNYESSPNPYGFQMSVNVRPNTSITWSNNLETHLGCQRMDFKEYKERIHPDWACIYWEFILALYNKTKDFGGSAYNRNWSFYLKVPLRDKSGGYAWYGQSIIPVEFDGRGMMVSHVNLYTYLEPYRSYCPGGPTFRVEGKTDQQVQTAIRRNCEKRIFELFFKNLRPYERNALRVMRALCDSEVEKLDVMAVGEKLQVSKHAVYKYSYRIMEVTRDSFPVPQLKTVESLAVFLNAQFGRPSLS